MQQRPFNWWPYGVLAPAIVLLTVLAHIFAGSNKLADEMVLSVFGAGTGYLLGLMHGSLSRTMVGILFGALAGVAAWAASSVVLLAFVIWCCFLISFALAIYRKEVPKIYGALMGVVALFLVYQTVLPAVRFKIAGIHYEQNDQAVVAETLTRVLTMFPLLSALLSPLITTERTFRSVVRAASQLCNASVLGQTTAIILGYGIFYFYASWPHWASITILSICLMLAYHIFARQIFVVLERTKAPDSVQTRK